MTVYAFSRVVFVLNIQLATLVELEMWGIIHQLTFPVDA